MLLASEEMLKQDEIATMEKITDMIDISVDSFQNDISTLSPLSSKKKLPNQTESIKTFCRIRPFGGINEVFQIKADDDKVLLINTDKLPKNATIQKQINSYTFSKTFGENSTQSEVFESTCRQLVEDLLFKKKSGLIFTYGMTNAGKTFTVTGSPSAPGILPQSLKYLLDNYNNIKTDNALYCNFVEIYQDDVFDLLSNDPMGKNRFFKKKISVKENNKNIFYLSDATFIQLDTIDEFNNILSKGIAKKVHSATNLNQNSSRSHTIFKIILREKDCVYDDPNIIDTSLSIVDLAGSERANRSETTGKELQEACKINQSLSILGKCLEAMKHNSLYTQKKMVPFRESKLTKLFCEYFQGEQNIIMITNINPRTEDFEETLRALNYSCIAKEIKPIKSRIVNNNPLRKIIKVNNGIKGKGNDELMLKRVSLLSDDSGRNSLCDNDLSFLDYNHNNSTMTTSLALPENIGGNETINKLILEIQKLRNEVSSIKIDTNNVREKEQQHPQLQHQYQQPEVQQQYQQSHYPEYQQPHYGDSNINCMSYNSSNNNSYTPQMISPSPNINTYDTMLQRIITPMIDGDYNPMQQSILDSLPMQKMPGVNLFFINSKFNDFHMNKKGLIPEENESEEEDNYDDIDNGNNFNVKSVKKNKRKKKARAKSNKHKPIKKNAKEENTNKPKRKNNKPKKKRAKTGGRLIKTPLKRITIPNAYEEESDTLQSTIEIGEKIVNYNIEKQDDNQNNHQKKDELTSVNIIHTNRISNCVPHIQKIFPKEKSIIPSKKSEIDIATPSYNNVGSPQQKKDFFFKTQPKRLFHFFDKL